jgi:hypothetical protein
MANHSDAEVTNVEFREISWQNVCGGRAASELVTGKWDITWRQEIGVETPCIERKIVAGGHVDGECCVHVRLWPDVGLVEAVLSISDFASGEKWTSMDSQIFRRGPESDQPDAGPIPLVMPLESGIYVIPEVWYFTVMQLGFRALAEVSREKMLLKGARHCGLLTRKRKFKIITIVMLSSLSCILL